jgi:hypothetical protein
MARFLVVTDRAKIREFGKTKCRWFLKQRASEVAGRADTRRDRPAEPARPS